MKYEIFSRKAYRREGGEYVPYAGSRRVHICYRETIEEAREVCADGPANKALKAGKEYRHLSFYEFESA